MAKRRTHAQDGKFIADNPETPNVDEAWVEIPATSEAPTEIPVGDHVEAEGAEAAAETPSILTGDHQEVTDEDATAEISLAPKNPLAPVELELKFGSQENKLPEKLSKEKIEAAVKEKLSRKTDSPDSNPFIPQTQLENEVKEVAKIKGFPLSRGTEIGARLLARSKRRPN